MTDDEPTPGPRKVAEALAHSSPAEALVYAVLDLADAFRAAWPAYTDRPRCTEQEWAELRDQLEANRIYPLDEAVIRKLRALRDEV